MQPQNENTGQSEGKFKPRNSLGIEYAFIDRAGLRDEIRAEIQNIVGGKSAYENVPIPKLVPDIRAAIQEAMELHGLTAEFTSTKIRIRREY